MKNEFLMDSFGYISDEYIAEAASFQKKSRSVTWIPYAGIAAAFLSIIGIFFLVKSTVMKNKTSYGGETSVEDTALPETGLEETVMDTSGTEATVAMTRPAVDEGKVLFAPDKSAGECHDEMVGAPMGEVLMPYQLQQEIGKTENKDEYFSVTFMVCRFEYVEQYREEMAATYPDRVSEKRLIELFGERIKEDVHNEMDRLIGLGYRIEIVPLDEYVDREGFVIEGENGYHVYNGFTVTGYLTGEQLSNFGADPNHGYRFTWNTKDGEIGVSDE